MENLRFCAVLWHQQAHLSRTGRLMLPKAEWNAPVYSLLQLAQRPLRTAGRTPVEEHNDNNISVVLQPTVC